MGIETAIALGVSYAANAYNQNKSAHDAESAQRHAIMQNAIDRAKAEKLVGGNISALRASNPEAERAKLSSEFVNQLRANAARTDASTPAVAGANPRYAQTVKTENTAADAHTQKMANFITAIRAAQNQRQNEGMQLNDTATSLGGIQQDTGQDMANSALAINKAAQPNPWISYLGQIAGNVGKSGVFDPKVSMPAADSEFATVPSGASSPVAPNSNSLFNTYFH